MSYTIRLMLALTPMLHRTTQPDVCLFVAQYMLITGEALMTERQRNWRDIVRLSRAVRPVPRIRRPLQRFKVREPSICADCAMCHRICCDRVWHSFASSCHAHDVSELAASIILSMTSNRGLRADKLS